MLKPVFLAFVAALPSLSQVMSAGRNTVDIRHHAQAVYYYPASGTPRATVLFLPGDGGWRGLVVDMAASLAAAGVDVYGWDVKQYLSDFTKNGAVLSKEDIQRDTADLAAKLGARTHRMVLVGWSQGAAMSVLTAAAPATHDMLSGVVVLGLPEFGILGWRLVDNLTYVTKNRPNEPQFGTAEWMPAIAPLRFGMIHSTADEYVSVASAKRLFSLAQDPKRFSLINAQNHRYAGARDELFRTLREQVQWAAGN